MPYKPILDLIAYAEGTSKKRTPKAEGYNTTLSYGAYTGGSVNLTAMTLAEVDDLQTRMLRHPRNKWNSSAVGRYQIVRTTLRRIKKALGLSDKTYYDEETQDKMAVYLLRYRGLDKYLAGKLQEDQLILNLSKEWASFPQPNGRGYYSNQRNTPISVTDVRQVLRQIKEDRPVERQEVEVAEGKGEHWLLRLIRVFFKIA